MSKKNHNDQIQNPSRRNLLTALGLVGGGLVLSSCTGQRVKLGDTFGAEFGETTQAQYPVSMTPVDLYGGVFFIHSHNLDTLKSLPFAYVPYNKADAVFIGDKRQLIPHNIKRDVYVPVPVLVTDPEDGQVKHAKQLTFSPEDVDLDGLTVNGIRIDTSVFGRKSGNGDAGYTLSLTEKDIEHRIGMTNILGQDYFYPHVSLSEKDKQGKLNVNLMPYNPETTKRILDFDTGEITVRDERGIYRPMNLQIINTLVKAHPEIYIISVRGKEGENLPAGSAKPGA